MVVRDKATGVLYVLEADISKRTPNATIEHLLALAVEVVRQPVCWVNDPDAPLFGDGRQESYGPRMLRPLNDEDHPTWRVIERA